MLDVILISSVGAVTGMVIARQQQQQRTQRREAGYQAFATAADKLRTASPSQRSSTPRLSRDPQGPSLRLQREELVFHVQAEVLGYDTLQATVSVSSPPPHPLPRLWIGWDVRELRPPNWHHVQRLPLVTDGLHGEFRAFGDDTVVAQQLVDHSFLNLLDLRRETKAYAMTVELRSDYVRVKNYRCVISPHAVERMVWVADRITQRWLNMFVSHGVEQPAGRRPIQTKE